MIYIRTDMNASIATGHVMRCLSIADAAKHIGEESTFILADGQALELIKNRGHHFIVLNTTWNDMESELPVLKNVIQNYSIQKLLIDSYQVTPAYLSALSDLLFTLYIDDLNAFHYPVHAIICYAAYWKKFKYKENYIDTDLYLGASYAPLREVFCQCRRKHIKNTAHRLLLLSGGADTYHILETLLDTIEFSCWTQIDVICGTYHPDYEKLQKKYEYQQNILIHRAVTDIEKYMKQADIAISAGGSTLYELCALGTPAISYSFADNQLDNVNWFQKEQLIDYAGDVRRDNIYEKISQLLEQYRENKELRLKRSKRQQILVDGRGAQRIAKILCHSPR